MPVIELSAISKHYEMGQQLIRAVDNLDLSLDYNEYVVFIGSSGSGKSTLMNIIGCLDTPTSGRYVLNGHDVSGLDDERRRLSLSLKRVEVQAGLSDDTYQELTGGIAEGDAVITGPDRVLRALKDGDRIVAAGS